MFIMVESKLYAISGAGGFIGAALTKRLEGLGHKVVAIGRALLDGRNSLKTLFEVHKPDYIVHLAAYGNHYNQKGNSEIVRANIIYLANLLITAGKIPVYNFSSSSVTLKEKTPYSVTKLCGEQIASLFPNAVNIRPYSVYGPGEATFRFIPTVIRALNTGEQITLDEPATHDWIFLNDFIEAFLNGYTEIGTGVTHTNIAVVKILEEISGKKLNYKPGKLRSYDNENWVCKDGVPHMDIREGLKKTYLHYTK
jgi:nucleoside-diphosphate-sugar epimerase